MKPLKRAWIFSSALPWRIALAIAGVCYLSLLALYMSGGREIVNRQVINPLEFHLRNSLGYEPKLHSRIKMFAVDHKAMAEIGLESIPIEQWTSLFDSIKKRRPGAIFVDKTFPLPITLNQKSLDAFRNSVASAWPIVAGAFYVETALNNFSKVQLNDPGFEFRKLKNLNLTPGYVYGPHGSLMHSFSHLGHINYDEHGFIRPLIRTSEEEVIAFWSLQAVAELGTSNGELTVNGKVAATDSEGKLLVNLASPDSYWKNTLSLNSLFKQVRSTKPLDGIEKGDIVIILSDMVQGSTFKWTPAGTMPGGFIMAEVMNSALTGKWLTPVSGEPVLLLLGCAVGLLIATQLNAISYVLALFSIQLLIFAAGISGFIFYGLLMPWGFPSLGLLLTSVAVFTAKSRRSERRSQQLSYSLSGMLDEKKLDEILAAPENLKLQPTVQNLSIMFIDIVGFSKHAGQNKADVVFDQLRDHLTRISEIVFEFGGIVDKSLGDGLLCYFGYQFTSSEQSQIDHANQAVLCAIRIQREMLRIDLSNGGQATVFPLRIGVNTGEVHIGDLGTSKKVEFTIIGHAVNLAQRLENSCEIFRVMIGTETHKHFSLKEDFPYPFERRLISIKHHDEKIESFEINPFFDNPALVEAALILYRQKYARDNIETRTPVLFPNYLTAHSPLGEGVLVDYSLSGFSIKMKTVIGPGTILEFTFKSDDGLVEAACASSGMSSIKGEVRWNRSLDQSYQYGILIKGLELKDRERLFQILHSSAPLSSKAKSS